MWIQFCSSKGEWNVWIDVSYFKCVHEFRGNWKKYKYHIKHLSKKNKRTKENTTLNVYRFNHHCCLCFMIKLFLIHYSIDFKSNFYYILLLAGKHSKLNEYFQNNNYVVWNRRNFIKINVNQYLYMEQHDGIQLIQP